MAEDIIYAGKGTGAEAGLGHEPHELARMSQCHLEWRPAR